VFWVYISNIKKKKRYAHEVTKIIMDAAQAVAEGKTKEMVAPHA
jgi:hypothetical protein